jgi:hypothetical protein
MASRKNSSKTRVRSSKASRTGTGKRSAHKTKRHTRIGEREERIDDMAGRKPGTVSRRRPTIERG